jgi:hypothetical protein
VTRQRKLKEVLNVRLDAPLAAELRRIATAHGRTESDVARTLLSYGVEVERKLEIQRLSRHYEDEFADPWGPGVVDIQAEYLEGYRRPGEVGSVIDPVPDLEDEGD